MFRFASFLALACLTVAATALLNTSARPAQDEPREDTGNNAQENNRLATAIPVAAVSFHARFSLN